VDLGSETTVADDEAFSIMMWLKPDDFVNNYFIGKGPDTDYVRFNSASEIRVRADDVTDLFTISAATAKEWVNLAIVRKASDDVITIYINGVAQDDVETANEPFDYRYLGSGNGVGFRGVIDGVLIYNAELSATEILRNFNATKNSHRN
jgi:hypothetical protein